MFSQIGKHAFSLLFTSYSEGSHVDIQLNWSLKNIRNSSEKWHPNSRKKHENEDRKQHVFSASYFSEFARFFVPFLVPKWGCENRQKLKRKTEADFSAAWARWGIFGGGGSPRLLLIINKKKTGAEDLTRPWPVAGRILQAFILCHQVGCKSCNSKQ